MPTICRGPVNPDEIDFTTFMSWCEAGLVDMDSIHMCEMPDGRFGTAFSLTSDECAHLAPLR